MRTLLLCLIALCAPLLGGCSDTVLKDAVSVSAINYTGRDLNGYLFENPDNGKVAGGPGLNPYEGGGTMCCYSLPRKWHKGIKVKLRYDWWAGTSDIRDYQYVTVEVPPYPTDEPGMLWALLYEDGSVEVVASAVDPGHPKWPGKVKHWPAPSREYKLKLWEEERKELHDLEAMFQEAIDNPTSEDFSKDWKYASERHPEDVKKYAGPDDPRFRSYSIQKTREALLNVRTQIGHLEARKP